MLFYCIIYTAILLIGLIERERGNQMTEGGTQFPLIVSLLILFLVAALRSNQVGADTYEYEAIYATLGTMPFGEIFTSTAYRIENLEMGYRLYNWILYQLFPQTHAITVANSLILIAVVYSMIHKNSQDCWLSACLFMSLGLYQAGLSLVPSSIAAALVFSFSNLIEEGRLGRFFLVSIFTAFFFHTSALYLLPFFFLNRIELSGKRFVAVVIVGMLLGLGTTSFISTLLEPILPAKYLGYIKNTNFEPQQLLVGLELLTLAIVCKFLNSSGFKLNHSTNLTKWVVLANIVIFAFVAQNTSYGRFALMLRMYFIVCIPNWINTLDKSRTRPYGRNSLFLSEYDRAAFLIVVLTSVAYVARMFLNNIAGTMPYSSVLFLSA